MIVNLLNRLAWGQKNQFTLFSAMKNSLCLIPFMLLLPSSAKSAEYAWAFPGTQSFPSPSTACTWHLSIQVPTRALEVLRISDTEFMCRYEYWASGAGQWALTSVRTNRLGTSCGLGKVFNPDNGECMEGDRGRLLGKGDPGTCPSPLKHDPINTSNGNSIQTEVDYPSSNLSTLNFTRVYNSLDGLWRHNHSTYLRITSFATALVMADGRESFFTISGSTLTASPTELGRLTKTADTWLYTAKNNDTYSFDATGRLTRWTNAAGAEHLLSYVNGTVTVTDKLGQTLSFTEDAQHQPLTLTTSWLTIQYEYNASQRLSKLTRTRDGQTETRQFHYEKPNKPNLLTGITDERGVRFTTWTFDDQDRATSSEHAGGVEHGDVVYNADGSSTVINEFGKKSIYRFVTIDGVKRVSAIEGEALGSCPMSNSTFTYDARGLLKTKTDNKGFVTTYDYNERGLEVSRTEASGTPQARTTTTTWHTTLNLPLTVTEPGRVTTYTYDAQGRQLSQTSASTAL
jgi:YD repeat-containing protein